MSCLYILWGFHCSPLSRETYLATTLPLYSVCIAPTTYLLPTGQASESQGLVLQDVQYFIQLVINKPRWWFAQCLQLISHQTFYSWKPLILLWVFTPKVSSNTSCSKQLLPLSRGAAWKFKSHYFKKISALQDNFKMEGINQNLLCLTTPWL
jgi:hypothetical protein